MRYELIDYQREAAVEVIKRLGRARRDWLDDGVLSGFALSAITGSGKTVIATAVIEALIHGSSDLEMDASASAAFLWVTDDPALNRQTRNKMIEGSDLLRPSRLVILDNDFLESELSPGHVYFLNIQKLSKTAGFAQGGNNLRQYSGWDVIKNTVESESVDLYLVLDEAHRGMRQSSDRASVVQRIIGGRSGSNPPVPIVWGISATIERFTTAMAASIHMRSMHSPVVVPIERVRASGIVKDQIDIDEPDESGTFSSTLLREAVDTTLEFDARWRAYSSEQSELEVVPALVIQVADKIGKAALTELIAVVDEQWHDLGPHAIVNVFGEHADLDIGGRSVRWVPPESIQAESDIRVVLAKEAISTGWDCPRAEVLFSDRPAKDATHIAQIIGRMVRSPLARRIPTDDFLNGVRCFLPRFNRNALNKVTAELTRPGEPGGATEVVVHARMFESNTDVPAEVYPLIEGLPSWPKPDAMVSPLRRAKSLAKLLTDSSIGAALLPDAGEQLTSMLNSKLDGLMAEHAKAVEENVDNIENAQLHRMTITTTGEPLASETRRMRTATRDIERDTRRAVARLKEGVGKDYLKCLVQTAGDEADTLALRTRVAGLVMAEGVVDAVDDAATSWVQDQLTRFAVGIKNSTGALRDSYLKVKEQTSVQEETGIELPDNLKAGTRTSSSPEAEDLPLFRGHVFADEKGQFPAKLNTWETTVVETEIDRPSFVAWYRNPSRASASALRVGYLRDDDEWDSLQVDFLVVSRRSDKTLGVALVDPHGDHLADARAKLHGLAEFAERFGDRFIRIESIAEGSGAALRSLDLLDPKVRNAIRAFEGGKVTALFDSEVAQDYA